MSQNSVFKNNSEITVISELLLKGVYQDNGMNDIISVTGLHACSLALVPPEVQA